MTTFRKKAECVKAQQYRLGVKVEGVAYTEEGQAYVRIKGSKFARVNLKEGDWVLTLSDGTRDVVPERVFEETYEEVSS